MFLSLLFQLLLGVLRKLGILLGVLLLLDLDGLSDFRVYLLVIMSFEIRPFCRAFIGSCNGQVYAVFSLFLDGYLASVKDGDPLLAQLRSFGLELQVSLWKVDDHDPLVLDCDVREGAQVERSFRFTIGFLNFRWIIRHSRSRLASSRPCARESWST